MWRYLGRIVLWGMIGLALPKEAKASPEPGSREWVRQQAERVHKRGGYPRELPQHRLPEPKEGWFERLLRWLFSPPKQGDPLARGMRSTFSVVGEVMMWVLYALLAVTLLLGLAVFVRFLRESIADARERSEAQAETVAFFGVELPLDKSPEAWMAEGRLDLALCALLLRAMLQVGWKDDRRGKSQTAREVIALVEGRDPRKPPLLALLRLVEHVRFGGAEATHTMISEGQDALRQIMAAPSQGERRG